MRICEDGHEEVCHEGRSCPACELKGEKKRLEEKIEELQKEIKELQEQIEMT